MVENELNEVCRAYHEAGHAVVGTLRGFRVVTVTIVPSIEREAAGHCEWEGLMNCVDVWVAGAAAEAIPMLSSSCWHILMSPGSERDYCEALKVAGSEGSVRESAALVRELVQTHHAAVKAIVDGLLEFDTLSGDLTRELIANA